MFSKNLSAEVQNVFDGHWSQRKQLKQFTMDFNKKMGQESEIEKLKLENSRLKSELKEK
jgi:predicted RNase H-like nuclease (RuvC/YqgF family)